MSQPFSRMRFFFGLLMAVGLFGSTISAQDQPVTIKTSIEKSSESKGQFRLNVDIDIQNGWHMYDKVRQGTPYTITEVELNLPDGVQAVQDWKRPVGLPSLKDPEIRKYEGSIRFARELMTTAAEPADVGVTVSYQVCRGEVCRPPQEFVTTAKVPAADTADAGDGQENASFQNKYFSAPQRLMVGDQPLNAEAKQMYPSPAMYDIDQDGQLELVVGDIFGTLNVYENENDSGSGEPAWSRHVALKSSDGQRIKVSNW